MASEHKLRKTQLTGSLPAVAVAVVALWELAATLRADAHIPTTQDWQQAHAYVAGGFQDGDGIVFAPAWSEPTGRHYLGGLMSVTDAARMDLAGHTRIWEVSFDGARHMAAGAAKLEAAKTFGELTVRRYKQAPVATVTDFVATFRTARRRGAASVSVQEVDFRPRRCVVMRPRPGGEVSLEYLGVALGQQLVGYGGLADVFTRRDHRQPVWLTIRMNGKVVVQRQITNDGGWQRFAVPTQATPAARVEIVARVDKGAKKRNLCLALEARSSS